MCSLFLLFTYSLNTCSLQSCRVGGSGGGVAGPLFIFSKILGALVCFDSLNEKLSDIFTSGQDTSFLFSIVHYKYQIFPHYYVEQLI